MTGPSLSALSRNTQQTADISKKRKRLAAAQKRAGELERLICKIYEDNALGKLPDARYEAWTHSMPKSRTLSMRKSRNWKRPLPAMSRAGNLRRSLLP